LLAVVGHHQHALHVPLEIRLAPHVRSRESGAVGGEPLPISFERGTGLVGNPDKSGALGFGHVNADDLRELTVVAADALETLNGHVGHLRDGLRKVLLRLFHDRSGAPQTLEDGVGAAGVVGNGNARAGLVAPADMTGHAAHRLVDVEVRVSRNLPGDVEVEVQFVQFGLEYQVVNLHRNRPVVALQRLEPATPLGKSPALFGRSGGEVGHAIGSALGFAELPGELQEFGRSVRRGIALGQQGRATKYKSENDETSHAAPPECALGAWPRAVGNLSAVCRGLPDLDKGQWSTC
jgi:hypothetical protein